jgi:hypothetical protein
LLRLLTICLRALGSAQATLIVDYAITTGLDLNPDAADATLSASDDPRGSFIIY